MILAIFYYYFIKSPLYFLLGLESIGLSDRLCWGLKTPQHLWVILCQLLRKGEKRRDSRGDERKGDEREGQGRKRDRNEMEETEEIKTFSSTLTCCNDSKPCQTVNQYQLDAPVT